MKKRYLGTVTLLTCMIGLSYGQTASFLNSFSDARTAGMGNAGYVLSSPFAVHHNIAAMMPKSGPSAGVGLSGVFWQPNAINSTIFNVSGYTKFKNFGFAVGFRNNSLGAIEEMDDQGNAGASFSPSEYALEVGVGYNVSADISLGATMRQIGSNIYKDNKGSAVAADIALLYHSADLTLGLGLTNLGSKIDYGRGSYSLPSRFRTGAAYQFLSKDKHALKGVADAAYQFTPDHSGVAAGLGAEYNYNNMLSMRTGYHFEGEKVGDSYATLGGGVYFSGFSFDIAYMIGGSNSYMGQTMIFSLKWTK
ncbi:PorV/PorQ family protein [Proteiniphilum sp.]|uniref:PorV/PorQ family protein n=1 Tax=Proteiniphilum sp. TaxID=1926877 RepID=UPI002B1FC140|nr:PorV/PorQ family protein [Proteiniphilum sp.]MEA4916240.1 PorV/PorQ family protein [Proteiniphilum sp.]